VTADNKPLATAATEIKHLRDQVEQAQKDSDGRTGPRPATGRAGTSFQKRPATNEALAKPRQTHNTREV
jgi:hypothetical protein